MKALFAGLVLLFTGLIGMLIVSSIMNGFVLVKLWAWFVVPTFGLPMLSIPVAIGISMVVRFLTYQNPPNTETDTDDKVSNAITFSIFFPLMTLFIGWVVHFFV